MSPDTMHLQGAGIEWDFDVVPFDIMAALQFKRPVVQDLPDTITLDGTTGMVREAEVPVVRPPWPVVSQRVYDILNDTGPMPKHRFVPVRVELAPGTSAPDGLGILQLLEHEDVFDRERSVFEDHHLLPGRVYKVKHLAVCPFENRPVPAVFRLAAFPMPLFVSDAARRALDGAGVTGAEFRAPERWRG